jgi:hypothetical protein
MQKIEGNGSMSTKKLAETGVSISLSKKGFKHLPRDLFENVDESRSYCPSFVASFVSL